MAPRLIELLINLQKRRSLPRTLSKATPGVAARTHMAGMPSARRSAPEREPCPMCREQHALAGANRRSHCGTQRPKARFIDVHTPPTVCGHGGPAWLRGKRPSPAVSAIIIFARSRFTTSTMPCAIAKTPLSLPTAPWLQASSRPRCCGTSTSSTPASRLARRAALWSSSTVRSDGIARLPYDMDAHHSSGMTHVRGKEPLQAPASKLRKTASHTSWRFFRTLPSGFRHRPSSADQHLWRHRQRQAQ